MAVLTAEEVFWLRELVAEQALTLGTLKDELGRVRGENAKLQPRVDAQAVTLERLIDLYVQAKRVDGA